MVGGCLNFPWADQQRSPEIAKRRTTAKFESRRASALSFLESVPNMEPGWFQCVNMRREISFGRILMRKLVLIALAGAALFGAVNISTTTPVSAQGIYIGPGYVGPAHRRYVAPRYRYARPRYVQPYRPAYRQQCPPRYTVQDGVCKPYRGY
jgi:hypothetical protein